MTSCIAMKMKTVENATDRIKILKESMFDIILDGQMIVDILPVLTYGSSKINAINMIIDKYCAINKIELNKILIETKFSSDKLRILKLLWPYITNKYTDDLTNILSSFNTSSDKTKAIAIMHEISNEKFIELQKKKLNKKKIVYEREEIYENKKIKNLDEISLCPYCGGPQINWSDILEIPKT